MTVTLWNDTAIMARLEKAASDGIRTCGAIVEREMRSILGRSHGGVPSKPGQPPNSQTNFLRGQIRYEMRGPLEVAIGSGAFYGAILERGATIRAKKKAMLIPLSPEMKKLTRRGMRPGNILIALRFDKTRPLKYIKTKGGVMIVRSVKTRQSPGSRAISWGAKPGIGEADEPLFFMTSSVTIAARPWMRPAFAKARPNLLPAFTRTASRVYRSAAA